MGTVIDCWAGEPHINQELLACADLATAHIAGHSYSAKLQATEMLYRALCEHLGVASRDSVLFCSPPTAVLYAADTVDDETAIRQAVFSCYDVRTDSAALKNLLQIPQQARGVAFDNLRDHYPKRGEFRSIRVQLPCIRSQLGTTLEGLGFKIAGGSV
jgi:erythronate-4-phosphate dehydrogenase